MSLARPATRLLAILALTVSQIVFAYAHAAALNPAKPGFTVVICTPDGLQEIVWPLGEDAPSDGAPAPLCAFCILGAAISVPDPAPACCSEICGEVTHLAMVERPAQVTRPAPYPARAPPPIR
ncbi:MAG: hypothetical protein AAGE80_05095 [Pseudomonadota bacterium]